MKYHIEQWKWVPGYKGYYKVSNLGRVKSVGRLIEQRNKFGIFYTRKISPRYLQLVPSNGSFIVVLAKNGTKKLRFVYHLVLEAFVGMCPLGRECCHKNDLRIDNRLVNLYWGTRKQNARDARVNGRLTYHKLSPFQVRSIRKEWELSSSKYGMQTKLALLYNVHRRTILRVIHKEKYKWVK